MAGFWYAFLVRFGWYVFGTEGWHGGRSVYVPYHIQRVKRTMTRYVSENEWHGMRRDRSEGKTEREISAKYGYSRRIVRRVTADIKPGVEYSEDELRGLVRVSEPAGMKEPEKTDQPPGQKADQPEQKPDQNQNGPRPNQQPRPKPQKRTTKTVEVQQEPLAAIVEATKISPNMALMLVSEADRAGYDNIGDWLDGQVLTWMRFVSKLNIKFRRTTEDPLSPEQFEEIMDSLARRNVEYKKAYLKPDE